MKIIFVVSAMHGGGAERVIATLANAFSRRGDDVIILMTAGTEQVYQTEEKVKVISLGNASHGNLLLQLQRILRMRKFFVDHPGYQIVSFSTTINMFTILASLGLKNRVIVSERNDPDKCSCKKLRNFVYSFGQGFVFQTEAAKNCFSAGIRSRSVVIPNPVRTDFPEPFDKTDQKPREKKIAAVGRLEPQKNHMLLLEAFAEFHKDYPDYELHLFGKGSLEALLRIGAETLGIGGKVIFEGFCRDVLQRIKSYSMYVLSSDYEGISNSLMEAMAIGLPCISTDCPIGGSRLCIQDGENGRLIPIGDCEALQRAMEWIAQDSERAEAMGQRATGIRERFSEEKICQLWRAFIGGSTE